MKITVRYNRSTLSIELPNDATVAQLKDEVTKLTNISPENQKIIMKGKPLTELDKKLSELNIKNGAKLFLLSSEVENDEEKPKIEAPTFGYNQPHPPQPDQSIIKLGPPPGVLKNFQTEVTSLPAEPFIVRTNKGVAKLYIETGGLFVEYLDKSEDGSIPKSERIFAKDLLAFSTEQISKKDYFHLCLRAINDEYIFYFLPNQYCNSISRVIGNFQR